MKNCEDRDPAISALVSYELGDVEAEELWEHMTGCGRCLDVP